ncbi:Translation factor pelota [Sporothrix curviconia]|uniref:Translation factor pelota n=1 Tax=Sporothrix curviconia TaxID=1260050 RepID=A0ABP0AKN6_9PEZI
MKTDGTFSVVLESSEDVWCAKAILAADDKVVVEEGGVPVAKPLLVTRTSFSPATSTLTVTGTHVEETSVSQPRDMLHEASSTASAASAESQLSLFPGRTVTVERRLTNDMASKAAWDSACQQIRTCMKPDRRSEELAVVLLEKNGSSATLRVFEGEQLRLDKTIHTTEFQDDKIVDMPKMAMASSSSNGSSSGSSKKSSCNGGAQGEKACKDAKMARSTKGRMAPLQGNLYAAVIACLVRCVDLERNAPGYPLLIASLGEAAHCFQGFLQADATTKQDLPLLHMANNAVVVDTYGAASQAEPSDSYPSACAVSSSDKPKKKDAKKAGSNSNKAAANAAPASSANDSSFRAAFDANLWMPAQRKNRDKKNMCAFDEMMMRLDVLTRIHNVRFGKASHLVKDVQDRMREEEEAGALGHRAVYGAKVVKRAVQEGAVCVGGGVLLINKSLFTNKKLQNTLATLVTSVREEGGAVHILSDTHESGQRLAKIGGVAALLTFPLFGPDDVEHEEATKAEEGAEKKEHKNNNKKNKTKK